MNQKTAITIASQIRPLNRFLKRNVDFLPLLINYLNFTPLFIKDKQTIRIKNNLNCSNEFIRNLY